MATAFNLAQFRLEGITDRDGLKLYSDLEEVVDLWRVKVDADVGAALTDLPPMDCMFTRQAKKLFQEQMDMPDLYTYFVANREMPFIRAEIGAACLMAQTVVRFTVVGGAGGPLRSDGVPQKDWILIQHWLLATGFKKGFYVSTRDDLSIEVKDVPRDDIFIANHTSECIAFWDFVRTGKPPNAADPSTLLAGGAN